MRRWIVDEIDSKHYIWTELPDPGVKGGKTMNPALIGLIVSGLVSVIEALPKIVEAINGMDLPDATKEELLGRIKAAQESLQVWD